MRRLLPFMILALGGCILLGCGPRDATSEGPDAERDTIVTPDGETRVVVPGDQFTATSDKN